MENETAIEIFGKGYNCAQAVFASHSAELGLDATSAKKAAAAFGGGIAHNGMTCGAVTGALMLLGLKYGRYKDGDNESKEKTYKIANEFIGQFKKEFGSITCKDLIKFDVSVPEEYLRAKEAGVFQNICRSLVKRSSELVEEFY